MNAHTANAAFHALNAMATATPADIAAKRELVAAMAKYGNESTDRFSAIKAIEAGRAAFWKTTDWNNAVGGVLTDEANAGRDIVAFCKDRQIGRPAGFIVKHGLDVLVPLNAKATTALVAAYEAFGTFRSREELEARRTKQSEAV